MSNPSQSPALVSPSGGGAADSSIKRSFPWKWVVIALLLLVGGGIYAKFFMKPKAVAAAPEKPGRGGPAGSRSVPVATTAVKTADFRVFLNALGTVTALNTVTVKSRADGELKKINFTEGQVVNAGDLLAEIDSRSYEALLEQAEGQWARDSALLANARLDLERYMNAEAAVTQQQLATAKTLVAQYEGTVKADQGVVDGYKLQLSYCRVLAPISGRVGLRLVDQGNLIKSSDASGLVVITQERPITVAFSLPEDSLPALRKSLGGEKPIRVTAFDRSGKNMIARGKVASLDNQIDPSTGTVRLKAIFDNEDDALFPNQFVNVRVLVEVQTGALLIPSSAVQINGPARFVYVVKGESVERRAIVVGKTEGEQTSIEKGLADGELVVTDGLDKLQDGSKVSMREPGAGGPGGGGPGGPGGAGAGGESRGRTGERKGEGGGGGGGGGERKEKRAAAPAATP